MGYLDFPVGTYRTQTCNETITNWRGTNLNGTPGSGAVRVFTVLVSALVTGANASVKLFNGTNASSTANCFMTVTAINEFQHETDFHAGLLFPNGCFITTGGAIDYATVVFKAETL